MASPPRRFGIAARIALIMVAALVLVQLLMLAAYWMERRRVDPGNAAFMPLMAQMAAVVRLLDRIDPAQRDLALQASTSAGFMPRYLSQKPDITTQPLLRPVARRLRELTDSSPERFIAVSLVASEARGGAPVRRLRELSGARLQTVIALRNGGYLEVLAGGDLTVRLLGMPVGLMAGFLGFLVALVALLAVRHETRPLSTLADAVERFGTDLEPQKVPERGAPDVRTVIRAINAMQARIADLVRTRTLVLGAISHDLRTYLTRLKLRLELLPPDPQVAKAKADLDDMQALVNDALSFARASFSGASDETVDLSALATAEYDTRLIQGAEATLTGAETPHLVSGSPGALARVLANLVGNALTYGGRADISLLEEAEGVEGIELRVEDRGPGIPPAEREAVFEPFYRVEPSRNRESGGAGLGLTIVRQIVEGHGGKVLLADRPGGGARVRVILPRAIPPQGRETRPRA